MSVMVTILFNILSVVTLNNSLHAQPGCRAGDRVRWRFNPLIIGIVLALPVSIAGLRLPAIVLQSGEYFANMTLPLALLCTGAALDFRSLRHDPRDTVLAAAGKLLLVPLLFVGGGGGLGLPRHGTRHPAADVLGADRRRQLRDGARHGRQRRAGGQHHRPDHAWLAAHHQRRHRGAEKPAADLVDGHRRLQAAIEYPSSSHPKMRTGAAAPVRIESMTAGQVFGFCFRRLAANPSRPSPASIMA
jgi:hypothetical protein